MTFKIFYSWQSDLPDHTNRTFIRKALSEAVRKLNENISTDEADEVIVEDIEKELEEARAPSFMINPNSEILEIDSDTTGVMGSPDIVNTIFTKIEQSTIFICDVSIINSTDSETKRKTPNPNVMIELGYASAHRSWDNIILVANTGYGSVEALPFDIRQRRIVKYHFPLRANNGSRTVSNRVQTKASKELIKNLTLAIKTIINAETTKVSDKEKDKTNDKNFEIEHTKMSNKIEQKIQTIQTRGYYEVIIRPSEFTPRFNDTTELINLIEKSIIQSRGRGFPIENHESNFLRGNDWIGMNVDRAGYNPLSWRFYSSGQFIFVSGLENDWYDKLNETRKVQIFKHNPGQGLSLKPILRCITEIFEFVAKLYTVPSILEKVTQLYIKIEINSLDNRVLYKEGGRPLDFYYEATDDQFIDTHTYSKIDIITQPKELALATNKKLCSFFGWDSVDETRLREWQDMKDYD